MKVTVLAGQSLADVAMQVYGSLEGVFTLATENGLDVTADLSAGQQLDYNPIGVLNRTVTEYFSLNSVTPATTFVPCEQVFDLTFDHTFNGFNYEQNN